MKRPPEGLSNGALDFVVAERPLVGEDDDYTYKSLTRDDLIVCARSAHRHGVRRNGITVTSGLRSVIRVRPLSTLDTPIVEVP